jgi:hypothetical protein
VNSGAAFLALEEEATEAFKKTQNRLYSIYFYSTTLSTPSSPTSLLLPQPRAGEREGKEGVIVGTTICEYSLILSAIGHLQTGKLPPVLPVAELLRAILTQIPPLC